MFAIARRRDLGALTRGMCCLTLSLMAVGCTGNRDGSVVRRPGQATTGTPSDGQPGVGAVPVAGASIPGRVQAEDYVQTSAPLTISGNAAQMGNQVIAATQPNTTISYQLAVGRADTYAVVVRTAAPTRNASLAVHVRSSPVTAQTLVASTGAANAFTSAMVRNVVLAAGTQTLEITLSNDGALLDWIDIVQLPAPPVAVPGHLGWSNMDEGAIASSPAQWTFVARYLDSLEWGNNNLGQLKAAAAALSPNAIIALSSGGLMPFTGATPTNWAAATSASIGTAIGNVEQQANVKVAEIHVNQDPVGPLKSLCAAAAATDSNTTIANRFATALQSVATTVHGAHPNARMAMFLGTPVATTWQNMPAFGGPGISFTVNSLSYSFDTFPILSSYFSSSVGVTAGYITDSPAEYFGNGDTQYDAKILAYERWLHGIDQQHTLITDRYNCASNSPTSANECYYNAIMNYLHIYQAAGGRADTYLIFQLHNGPSSTLPETTPFTFANTVMDAIKYIKGQGQLLDLTVQGMGTNIYQEVPDASQTREITLDANGSTTFSVQMKNNGDVTAMPVLRAALSGDGNIVPTIVVNGVDATTAVVHGEGYVFTTLLAPGASATCSVSLQAEPQSIGPMQLTLEGLWNPQDPSSVVRDAVRVAVNLVGQQE